MPKRTDCDDKVWRSPPLQRKKATKITTSATAFITQVFIKAPVSMERWVLRYNIIRALQSIQLNLADMQPVLSLFRSQIPFKHRKNNP
jgi:hypothetical protein